MIRRFIQTVKFFFWVKRASKSNLLQARRYRVELFKSQTQSFPQTEQAMIVKELKRRTDRK